MRDQAPPTKDPGCLRRYGDYLPDAAELVFDVVFNTVAAVIDQAVYFEVVLADGAGRAVLGRCSDPDRRFYPPGAALDAALTAGRAPRALARLELGGRTVAATVAPLTDAKPQAGALVTLVEGRPPVDTATVSFWATLIDNRCRLHSSVDKALTENEQMLQIMNTIQDGFMAADKHGVITFLNRAGEEIFGMKAEDVVGRHMVDAFKFEPQLLKVLANGVGWTDREFHITLPHGGQVHLLKSAIPIFDDDGELVGVVDTFRKFTKVRHLVNTLAGRSLLTFNDLIAHSAVMKSAIAQARKAAANLSTVLLQGESGTGKELFAQAIHNASARAGGPFIVIDCSSLPRELIESELFGYVEGTFTGSSKGGRPGKFELASGGTVLLDEIGEMPLDLQTRLLRVLQSRTVTRLGSSSAVPVDIMIIAATNKDLRQEVESRRFRQDLYYRLNIVSIHIPPLRGRPEDIPVLAGHFTRRIGLRMGRPVAALSTDALRLLSSYYWPGNVRELENAIERAYSLLDGPTIYPEHLPEEIISHSHNRGRTAPASPAPSLRLTDMERELIEDALAKTGGNRAQAARLLGISRSTLYEKLRSHSLQ